MNTQIQPLGLYYTSIGPIFHDLKHKTTAKYEYNVNLQHCISYMGQTTLYINHGRQI